MHTHLVIKRKDVYVFESHHHALLPWSFVRRTLDRPPVLITLDHHTDTMSAFEKYIAIKTKKGFGTPTFAATQSTLASAIDWKIDSSIEDAISKLKYDEHIHAAVLAGIIDVAFSINQRDQTQSIEEVEKSRLVRENWDNRMAGLPTAEIVEPIPPFTYAIPEDRIFCIESFIGIGFGCECVTDKVKGAQTKMAIESVHLEDQLAVANHMASTSMGYASVEEQPYILDIDLDYFHSEESINPNDPETLYRLIRNAQAITIAMEHSCVDKLKNDGESITSDSLLARILQHIESSLH